MTIRIFMLWILDFDKLKKLIENANCEILQEDISTDAQTVNLSLHLNNYVHLVIRDKSIIFVDHRFSKIVKINREDFSRMEVI